MELQTKVPLQPIDHPIDYQGKVLLLGSCFVENIGGKLEYFQFPQYQNPFGVLFQPLALENLVKRSLEGTFYHPEEVFCQEGIWRCFDAHSEVRSDDQKTLVELLNQRLRRTRQWVESASHIIITLGTAWVYEHNASQKIVANCHKVPQREFTKKLLSVDAIQSSLENLVSLIGKTNPNAKLIFTISPVRHLKDGFVENQQSKSHLIAALHQIVSSRAPACRTGGQSRGVSYFPAYEIMMDELRDYRFYAEDLLHPNALAVDYIWEKFKAVWISSEEYPVMDEVESVRKGLRHRPFNPGSEAHQKFKKSLRTKITYLQERYPFMKFE
ncbi:GSCFA domain-containing protein [Flagellimonas aequoris]|uniref:GSCFA domain-containing protein n=1 Tax=Flagellimonas aequoris TaxID=2306997 RepID=A0A418N744_9FLAO|nr:GSCFA domain-containing protein [Allomuricauda aequoris]RIV70507.1 GSCFA domain-containing protein [Allomuricauda aequoris]TXK01936.1 GSCFA domain-containing protein [Allomuricauda aequoris]